MTSARRPRGAALGLYGAAFLVMLAAGAFLGGAVLDELQETRPLWISAGLSYLAVVLALLSVLVPAGPER